MSLMFRSLRLWLGLLPHCFRSHRGLLLENLALRQQLIVFKRKRAKPRLSFLDKLFWVLARRFWPAWKRSLIVVTPETLARWHRAGFRTASSSSAMTAGAFSTSTLRVIHGELLRT